MHGKQLKRAKHDMPRYKKPQHFLLKGRTLVPSMVGDAGSHEKARGNWYGKHGVRTLPFIIFLTEHCHFV